MNAPAEDVPSDPRRGRADVARARIAGLRPLGGPWAALLRHDAARALAAATVAWSTTVAPAVFARASTTGAQALAIAALLAGLVGPLLPRRRLRAHVGLTLFIALTTGTWLLASASLQPTRIDPTRAAVGALAWGAFALSWSPPWRKSAPTLEAAAPDLEPRASLPPLAVAVAAMGVFAALVSMAIAWRVQDPSRAILAHAVALACGVALVTVGASVAVGRGKASTRAGRRFTSTAVRSLLILATFLAAGAAYLLLR